MYGGLDISVSGMVAQRTRVDTIAANLANIDSLTDSSGRIAPFRRKLAMLSPGDPTSRTPEGRKLGVHVAAIGEDQAPFNRRFEPHHPLADKDGYVLRPNIDPVTENINLLEAARAYEANAAAAEVSKSLVAQALRMLA